MARIHQSSSSDKPPRPSNAWIIYRSEKQREMKALQDPTKPKRPQAEVSKIIGAMWKAEPDSVKAHYDRLAELEKHEHKKQYPSYRFQPMKKEEKERIREEKRLEKEAEREAKRKNKRRSSSQTHSLVPSVHTPYYMPSPPEVTQTPELGCGPSPPMSDASEFFESPRSSGSESLSEPQSMYALTAASSPSGHTLTTPLPYNGLPHNRSQPNSRQSSHSMSTPQQLLHAPSALSSSPASPNVQTYTTFASDSVRLQSHHSSYSTMMPQLLPSGHASPMASLQSLSSVPPSEAWQTSQVQGFDGGFTANGDVSSMTASAPWSFDPNVGFGQYTQDSSTVETVSISMPTFAVSGWDCNDATSFEQDQAFIAATTDPSVFQLSGLDNFDFATELPTEFDVAQGSLSVPAPTPSMDDKLLELVASVPGLQEMLLGAYNSSNQTIDMNSAASFMPQSEQLDSLGQDQMMQFVNFDAPAAPHINEIEPYRSYHVDVHQAQRVSSSYTPVSAPEVTQTPSSYVPPSGAANTSMRRVAGSWRTPPTCDSLPNSPAEHAIPQIWGR
ncbi:Silenced mating-type M-specific polypeptide Mc [Grifola frondosa]|uniref:Silenced mating-type M-specific polypeptide Mc n=1 Tax=Grifola frondosa TaxID=5627 RepID=A0A1C7LUA4_GRIFR|nr:Silenced mating-type M-specific polypeptide Mc [Grifola frondosa]